MPLNILFVPSFFDFLRETLTIHTVVFGGSRRAARDRGFRVAIEVNGIRWGAIL